MVEVRVFITDGGREEQYGDPIKVTPSKVSSGYHDVICRVAGAAVLYNGRKVGIEILAGDGERKVIIGEEKIKDKLWWGMIKMFRE